MRSVCATKKDDPQLEVKLTAYCQVVNSLQATCATNDVTAEIKAEIINFKQLEGLLAARYSEVIWEKALGCGLV